MGKAADMPFYVKSQSGKGGAYNYAGTLGIPSVLIERGCNGMWSEEEVAASQKDVKNILRRIGMLKTRPTLAEMQMRVPKHMNHAHYVDSEKAGCWFPKKKAGQIVKAGRRIKRLFWKCHRRISFKRRRNHSVSDNFLFCSGEFSINCIWTL